MCSLLEIWKVNEMKLIVGLGNPGRKYQNTRHNVGFLAIDNLIEEIGVSAFASPVTKFNSILFETKINGEKIILAKPLTYMNISGEAVRPIIDWYKIEIDDLIIIYDDLALPLGKVRLREKGSSGGHNGVKSIIQHLGTEEFKRAKIGIDYPDKKSVVDYVLTEFKKEEKLEINSSIHIINEAIIDWVKGIDFKKIMSTYQKNK